MSVSPGANSNNSLTDTLIFAAEKLDWSCDREKFANGDYVRFGIYSPAGEAFSISVPIDRIVRGVRDAANSFDVDEHVRMWLDADRHGTGGVPSARVLVEDAEQIETMLNELAGALEEAQEQFRQGGSPTLEEKLTDAASRSTNQDVPDKSPQKETAR